ncbi:MAG TPA: DoxX family protein [Puia sp.]|jgi:hypothetical protein|nr:DoxX family protein [Puia sp.]
MKKIRIFYWIVTGIFLLMMAFSGIASLASPEQSVKFFNTLNMPSYLISFLSIAKLAGVIAILVPGYPRLKEWAYAGLTFDLIGAVYCNYAVGKPTAEWAPILIFIALAFASYFLYHKKLSLQPR